MKPVQIIPIIEESMQLLRASIPAGVEKKVIIPKACGTILAEPTQIHQVVLNLCTNAAHALQDQEDGVLRIGIADIGVKPHKDPQYRGMTPGQYVELTVSDNGCGMSKEIQNRIFDPYFTTKDIGKGTGMGLSVIHGIVENHGGNIIVDSEPGRGSLFRVLFPVISSGSASQKPVRQTPPGGSEKILLVDDEAALLTPQRNFLKRLGYAVEGINDPAEAFALFSQKPDQFDLVITDMAMPKMSGGELTLKILGLRPDVPIILCTGYSDNMGRKEATAMGIRKYIEKPFKLDELAVVIREILD